jgi:dinuclear metal center YbgI/SA1388 family protein
MKATEGRADRPGARVASPAEGRAGIADRDEVDGYLAQLLDVSRFKDYCPNGLQVEGKDRIARVVSAVTASAAVIRAAIAADADALIVHHGYFWRGEDPRVTGIRRTRLGLLLEHGISLFAFHLPLDAHASLGNNAQLGRVLGWPVDGAFGAQGLGCWHDLDRPQAASALASRVSRRLGRRPQLVGDSGRMVRRIAWCTGAAQDMLEEAIAAGADLFLSGEISERTTHLAREAGVCYVSAGHHATERYGVQALGAHLSERFGIAHRFVDDDNPV